MDTTTIRHPTTSDAAQLGALGRRTFVDTFVVGFGVPYPADDLARYLDASFDPERIATRLANPAESWWVAEQGGVLVAFAQAGGCGLPHPDARPTHGELKRLYVAREVQGSGLGRTLLEEALAWIAGRFDGTQWIGVWSGNLKAQRLYAHYGFTKVGEYDYPVGSWMDREHILSRPA